MESTFFKDILPEEGLKLLEENKSNKDFVILDVRTSMEFRMGKIEGAINMDMYSRDFAESVADLDKDKVYFIYCQTGARSSYAMGMFKQLGFKKVYNLARGIVGWHYAGYKIVR